MSRFVKLKKTVHIICKDCRVFTLLYSLPFIILKFSLPKTSEFGSKIVQPNKLLKMLLEIYDHPDQDVRASSKRLTLELCRWIGRDPVKSILFEKMSDTTVCMVIIFWRLPLVGKKKINFLFLFFLEERVGRWACQCPSGC